MKQPKGFVISPSTNLPEVIEHLEELNINDLKQVLTIEEFQRVNTFLSGITRGGNFKSETINNSIKACLLDIQRTRNELPSQKEHTSRDINKIINAG